MALRACGKAAGVGVKEKETGRLIGYARVSTEDQELRLQLDALERAGCATIYQEHQSATRGKRKQLDLAIMDLRPGDVLMVWKLDRLGRNLRQLYAIVDRIHAAGAKFKCLTEPIDFTTPWGELMFNQMGAYAQFEASMTSKRTAAGIAALKAAGFEYGPGPKLPPEKARQLVAMRKHKTAAEVAKAFKVSPATVNNYVRRALAAKAAKRKR